MIDVELSIDILPDWVLSLPVVKYTLAAMDQISRGLTFQTLHQ